MAGLICQSCVFRVNVAYNGNIHNNNGIINEGEGETDSRMKELVPQR